jgi:hypothetical protein
MDKLFSNIQQTFNEIKTDSTQNNNDSLLGRQRITEQKINELLEKSSQSILCGPTCQKTKVTEELKQKYLDAETNIQTAPIKLEQSKKNYYIYSEGRPYYENMMDEELNEKAKKISELLVENFNDAVTNANTINIYLNIALINSEHTKELLKQYLEENQLLKLKLRERHGDILTNDRKTYYETDALNNITLWYKLFWYIYYVLVIVLVLVLTLSLRDLTIFKKILVVTIFIFYPYYITYINSWIYGLWTSIVSRLPKNVYNDL